MKGDKVLYFAKNMDKNIGENISKNLSGKYSQKNFYHAKKSAIDAFKTASKIVIQKTAETTGDLIGDKTAKVSKYLQQNNSQTVKNENDKKIPKERYIFPEERQEVIDKLRSN